MPSSLADHADLDRWGSAPHIRAIVLLRDGQAFLDAVLSAIARQTRPVDELILVDFTSRDNTGARAQSAADAAGLRMTLVTVSRRAALVDAVAAAQAAADRAGADPTETKQAQDPPSGGNTWLWLLHHDSIPATDTLEQLLIAAETTPSAAALGCKHLAGDDPHRLEDVGVTTSRWGAALTGIERGELDQGQHDQRRDVLAVRLTGMLIRRDVWEAVGGPEPALDGARNDIDLGYTLRRAGHRVVVAPAAVITHAHCERRSVRWYYRDRHDAWLQRLTWSRWWTLPVVYLWLPVVAGTRALWRLVLKQPQAALDELTSALVVVTRPDRIMAARSRLRRLATMPRRSLRPLQAGPIALARYRADELSAWLHPVERPAPRPGGQHPRRRLVFTSIGLLTIAASVVAGWRLLTGSGEILAPGLLPAGSSGSDLWQSAHTTLRPLALGHSAVADPWVSLMSTASLPLGGDPSRVTVLLLVAGPVLAAISAWCAVGAWRRSVIVRAVAALVWATAPPLTAAVVAGRPAAVLAHVLLPLLAWAGVRTVRGGSVSAATASGLLGAAVIACAPVLTLPLAAVAALCMLAALVSRRPRRALLPLVAVAVIAVSWWSWWQAVARHPAALLVDPQSAPTPTSPWWLLVAQPHPVAQVRGLPGVLGDWTHRWSAIALTTATNVALVAGAVMVVVGALLGLLRRGTAGSRVLVWWWLALLGWGSAAVALVAAPSAFAVKTPTSVWTGAQLSWVLLALGVAALHTTSRGWRLADQAYRHRQVWAPALLVAPLVSGAVWVALSVTGPSSVRLGDPNVIPRTAVDLLGGPTGQRALVLSAAQEPGAGSANTDMTVRWNLLSAPGPRLGDVAVLDAPQVEVGAAARAADNAEIGPVITALVTAGNTDQRAALNRVAIGLVVVSAPADPLVVQNLDLAVGLTRVPGTGSSAMWRVGSAGSAASAEAAWARVQAADGTGQVVLATSTSSVRAVLPAGEANRRLVLAQRADAHWQATLDGAALVADPREGRQEFVVPAKGGELQVWYQGASGLWSALQVAALLLALLVALPLPGVRRRIAAPEPPPLTPELTRAPEATELIPVPQVFSDVYDPDAYQAADGEGTPHDAAADVEIIRVAEPELRRGR